MSDDRSPYELRSNEDGDLWLILAAEVDPEGWSVPTLHKGRHTAQGAPGRSGLVRVRAGGNGMMVR